MKKTSLFLFILFFGTTVSSQISIKSSDMPEPGDWYVKSTTVNTSMIDFKSTGTNYFWDFSQLKEMSQTVDTFIKVKETPTTFQFVFANFLDPDKANLASPTTQTDSFMGMMPPESFGFYKVSSSEYIYLGFGAEFMGTPIPLKYSDAEEIYKFPLSFGKSEKLTSFFETPVFFSSMFYYASSKKTNYTVDGWGKIKTPFGQFDAIRVKSIIEATDTFYLDSLGIGYSIDRPLQVKYDWLAKKSGIPILSATAQVLMGDTVVSQVVYQDILRTTNTNYFDEMSFINVSLYPNPTNEYLFVEMIPEQSGQIQYEIIDLGGRVIMSGTQQAKSNLKSIFYLDLRKLQTGIYLLKLNNGLKQSVFKFSKN
jgi:hypothetical protein